MNQEIELKFQIDEPSIKSLSRFFQNKKIVEQHSFRLTNTYYDNNEHILRNHRSSLRIRGIEEVGKPATYEITVKSAGNSLAGLHARQEYNASLPNSKLDLSVLPEQTFAEGIDKAYLSKTLAIQFSTDFHRQVWLIHFNHSQIEIALDQGSIVSNELTLPILEVELELKTGSQVDLLLLGLELSKFNIHLYSQSKAARGYRLLQNHSLERMMRPKQDNFSLSDILQYWQTNEEYALEQQVLSFYKEVLLHVADDLQKILPLPQNEYSTKLNQIYQLWLKNVKSIVDIRTFAFSEINTQLKIYLLLIFK